jgi:outer membrane lipoprotein SlyB
MRSARRSFKARNLKGSKMNTTFIKKSPHPLIWVTGVAIILFCMAGLAALMGWLPTSIGSPNDSVKITKAPEKTVSAKPHKAPVNTPSTYTKPVCQECGVIESTREIDAGGTASGIGAVGGAVLGGVLGHQVGDGRGKDVATVAGAVGGAVAGNEIEKRRNTSKSYEVTIRFDNGSSRVFNEVNSNWRNGDHVRITDGVIRPNG